MVGQVFRVLFSRKAQRRRRKITEFETRLADKRKARKVQHEIDAAAKKLEKLPNSNPIYQKDKDGTVYRYAKAYSYKLIFKVFEQAKEVFIITVRHDKEDSSIIGNDLK